MSTSPVFSRTTAQLATKWFVEERKEINSNFRNGKAELEKLMNEHADLDSRLLKSKQEEEALAAEEKEKKKNEDFLDKSIMELTTKIHGQEEEKEKLQNDLLEGQKRLADSKTRNELIVCQVNEQKRIAQGLIAEITEIENKCTEYAV